MLVKYISFLVFLLITVSWASSSDDDADKEIAASFYQVGEVLIKDALNTPEISSQLTSSSHAILSSIASKNEFAMSFYDFAVQKYKFHKLRFDSEDPQYWNAFINYPFRGFSRKQPDRAQEIIDKIVLPHHPFLSQVQFTFQTDEFLGQFIPDIDMCLDKVAYNIFAKHFSQILALEDQSEAQILLKALLHKAKNSSFPDTEFKYHHAFLANVPFDYFKKINYCHPEHHNSINSFIYQLAPILYSEIAEDSKQLADKILSGLLPSIYSTLTDTSYENTIGKYQESLLQPINNNAYLWDPHEFHDDLIEAVKALTSGRNYYLGPYLKMLEFLLSDDSHLAHLFRHYIAQNYFKPPYLFKASFLRNHLERLFCLFWRSLIFSSLSDFSAIFPHHYGQILQQLLLPSLDALSLYGNLDDHINSKKYFNLLSGWGHISTIELLLQSRTDISANDVGQALEHVAIGGNTLIIEPFLEERNTEISADHIGLALRNAAIVKLLLQSNTEISAYHIGLALRNAAEGGHTLIVELLLQYCDHIHADHIGEALCTAAEGGHTPIVELLLQSYTEISADHIGDALEEASERGHTPIVELLLQRRNDMLHTTM
jgi:hypothetical protein